jgi:hypothetical protein
LHHRFKETQVSFAWGARAILGGIGVGAGAGVGSGVGTGGAASRAEAASSASQSDASDLREGGLEAHPANSRTSEAARALAGFNTPPLWSREVRTQVDLGKPVEKSEGV